MINSVFHIPRIAPNRADIIPGDECIGSHFPMPWAKMQLPITGSLSLANMRLSTAANLAFVALPVNFSAVVHLMPYINLKLTVTDNTGKKLAGWIKAAGTAETYNPELFTGPTGTNWTVLAGVATHTPGATSSFGESGLLTPGDGKLYKMALQISSMTVGSMQFGLGQYYSPVLAAPGSYSLYGMAQADSRARVSSPTSNFDGAITNWTIKQVISPASTGVTIVSQKGGVIYNWTSMDAGFDFFSPHYTFQVLAG